MNPRRERRDSESRGRMPAQALAATAVGLCLAMHPGSVAKTQLPEVRGFQARSDGDAVLLTWTLVPQPRTAQIVIRFQADGPPPPSPEAGQFLFEAQNLPEGTYRCRHGGASPQRRYAYTVFTLDASGIVQGSTSTVWTPPSDAVPGTVRNLRRIDAVGASGTSGDGERR